MSETDDDTGLEQPKKTPNIRWIATHILPIFLVLIVGVVITVASVPSFRNSFNRFIAKWSPKADTEQTSIDGICSGITDTEASQHGASGRSDKVTLTTSKKVLNVGEELTFTATNQIDNYWYKSAYGGVSTSGTTQVGIKVPTNLYFTKEMLDSGEVSYSPESFGCSHSAKIKLGVLSGGEPDVDISEAKSGVDYGSIWWTTSGEGCGYGADPNPDTSLICNQPGSWSEATTKGEKLGQDDCSNKAFSPSIIYSSVDPQTYLDTWMTAKASVNEITGTGYQSYGYSDSIYICKKATETLATPEVNLYLSGVITGSDKLKLDGQEVSKLSEDTKQTHGMDNKPIDDDTEVYVNDIVKVELKYTNPNSSSQTVNLTADLDNIDNYDISSIDNGGEKNDSGDIEWKDLTIAGDGTKEVSFLAKITNGLPEITDFTNKNKISVSAYASNSTTRSDYAYKYKDYLLPITPDIVLASPYDEDGKTIYPGEEMKYRISFGSENIEPLNNFDIVTRLPKYTIYSSVEVNQESYFAKLNPTFTYDEKNNLLITHVDGTLESTTIQYAYSFIVWLKINGEVPFITNNTSIYQNDVEFKQIKVLSYWRNKVVDDYYRVSPDDLLKKDLSGIVKGKITGPYDIQQNIALSPGSGKGVPHVYVGLLTKQSDTDNKYNLIPSAKDLLDKSKYSDFVNMYYTKENTTTNNALDGIFEIKYNRNKDVTNYELIRDTTSNVTNKKFKIKYEVNYKDYKNTDSPENFQIYDLAIFANSGDSEGSSETTPLEQLYFRTESFEVSNSKVTEQNIDLMGIPSELNPKWEYPTLSNEQQYLRKQTIVAAEIYTNLRKARKFLFDKAGADYYGLPQTKVVLNFPGSNATYFNVVDKNIYLGDNAQILVAMRTPQSEFHEFGHLLLEHINNGGPVFEGFSSNFPDDKIPFKYINENHSGYLNDSTNDSVDEGFALFMQIWLDRQIYNYNKWKVRWNNGEGGRNLDFWVPISSTLAHQDLLTQMIDADWGLTGPLFEETAIAEIFREYVSGTPKKWIDPFATFNHLGGKTLTELGLIIPSDAHPEYDMFSLLMKIIKDGSSGYENRKVNSLRDLYDIIYNANVLRYNKVTADIPFLTHAIFRDLNCDGIRGIKEEIGYASSNNGFNYKSTTVEFKEALQNVHVDQRYISSFMDHLFNPAKKYINSINSSIKIRLPINFVEGKGQIGSRYWRELPFKFPGSYIKINFFDTLGQKIESKKIKVDIKSEISSNEWIDTNEVIAENNKPIYIELPFNIYKSKAVITAEGSSGSIVLDSEKYWNAINSTKFDYLMEKEFKVDGSTPPTFEEAVQKEEIVQKEKENSQEKSQLSLSITDEDGKKISKITAGNFIKVEANGFVKSSNVKVYVGNKEIDEIPVFDSSLRLKIKIPDDVMIGPTKIKLVGDKDETISSGTLWITSNQWINSQTLMLLFITIILIIAVIWAVRKLIINKFKFGQAGSNIAIVLVMVGAIGLTFIGQNVYAALALIEQSSLDTNKENIKDFIRLPESKFYNRKIPYFEQWGKPKSICFIQRFADKWNETAYNYFKGNQIESDNEKIIINDLSLPNGIKLSSYLLHREGLSISLWTKKTTLLNENLQQNLGYDLSLTQQLVELLNKEEFRQGFGIKNIYYGDNRLQIPEPSKSQGIFIYTNSNKSYWDIELMP